MEKYLKAVLDRFEGDFAVIKTEDRQEINWPKAKLPADAHEGDLLHLSLFTAEGLENEEHQKLAKEMLRQILKTDDKS